MHGKLLIQSILDLLGTHRTQVVNILDQLTNDAINWNPQNDRNSIANLIEHITASEAFHIQELILRQSINRNRDKEFEYRYRAKNELKTAYTYMANSTREILKNKITEDMLSETREVRGETKTVLWILEFVLQHNFYHIGQINYLAGLLRGDEFLERPRERFVEET